MTRNSVTFTPVNTWINRKKKNDKAIKTRPAIAYVKVFWAASTLGASPLAVISLNPPVMSIIKNTIPANERATETIFPNTASRSLSRAGASPEGSDQFCANKLNIITTRSILA